MVNSRRRWSKSEKLLILSPLLIVAAWLIAAQSPWMIERMLGRPRVIKLPAGTVLRGIALSSDGALVAAGGTRQASKGILKGAGDTYLADVLAAQRTRTIVAPQWREKNRGWVGWDTFGLALSPNGRFLTRCSIGSNNYIFDTKTGKQITVLPFAAQRAIFSSDGKYLALATGSEVHIWDVSKSKNIRTFRGTHYNDVEFSSDGKLLACIKSIELTTSRSTYKNYNGPVQIWEIATGKLYQELPGESTIALSFSQDGSRLVSVEQQGNSLIPGFYGRVRMCDVKTGRVLWTIEGKPQKDGSQDETVVSNDVAFSPDGNKIVQHNIRADLTWRDAATGELLKQMKPPGTHFDSCSTPPSMVFSADGKTLVSRAGDEVHIWDIKPNQ